MKVYLLKTEEEIPVYKIGFTKRPIEKRIKELKTGNSKDIKVVSIFESRWASKIEATFHHLFKHKRINGEWYEMTQEKVDRFIQDCESIHESFELLERNNFNNYNF
jgi:hypothetical protein